MPRSSRFCESSAGFCSQFWPLRTYSAPTLIIISQLGLPFVLMKSAPRLAVVMDPIADIKYAKDSTLAMLLAAQARGFEPVLRSSSAISPCGTA